MVIIVPASIGVCWELIIRISNTYPGGSGAAIWGTQL